MADPKVDPKKVTPPTTPPVDPVVPATPVPPVTPSPQKTAPPQAKEAHEETHADRIAAIEKRWGKKFEEVLVYMHDHIFGKSNG